jgi:hypothetical protein
VDRRQEVKARGGSPSEGRRRSPQNDGEDRAGRLAVVERGKRVRGSRNDGG